MKENRACSVSIRLFKITDPCDGRSFLHCIAEIRAHWVETKPFEIDNPRHHYQIA